MPKETTWKDLFERGHYIFRFEYVDKESKRRFEIQRLNDDMPMAEALQMVHRHVGEYGGILTNFVRNDYVKSFIEKTLQEELSKKVKEVNDANLEDMGKWRERHFSDFQEELDKKIKEMEEYFGHIGNDGVTGKPMNISQKEIGNDVLSILRKNNELES